jgi:hypothetical protein
MAHSFNAICKLPYTPASQRLFAQYKLYLSDVSDLTHSLKEYTELSAEHALPVQTI